MCFQKVKAFEASKVVASFEASVTLISVVNSKQALVLRYLLEWFLSMLFHFVLIE